MASIEHSRYMEHPTLHRMTEAMLYSLRDGTVTRVYRTKG